MLRDINLAFACGAFLGLIGPNGGGKTSLLRVLLGILKPTAGHPVSLLPARLVCMKNVPMPLLRQCANV